MALRAKMVSFLRGLLENIQLLVVIEVLIIESQ